MLILHYYEYCNLYDIRCKLYTNTGMNVIAICNLVEPVKIAFYKQTSS